MPRILEIALAILGLHQEGTKIVDLLRFVLYPMRLWYILRQRRQFLIVFLEAMVIMMRSSVNIRWLKFLGRLLLNPRTRLRDKALLRIAEIVCEVRRKSKEERGSPCLTPLLLENQGD